MASPVVTQALSPKTRTALLTAMRLGFHLPRSFEVGGNTYALVSVSTEWESATYFDADSDQHVTFGWADCVELGAGY